MKKIIALLLACIPLWSMAQNEKNDVKKYLEGAVPVVNGVVIFEKHYDAKGKTQQQIYDSLLVFTEKLIGTDNQLTQSRIMEKDANKGLIAANLEETLYFKKRAWVTDATRFFYQLTFECENDGFNVTMRRIRYLYEQNRNFNDGNPLNAEEWITDEHALVKNGTKLSRVSGKFRRGTIDRKDEIFKLANQAVNGKRKIKRIIYEEEVEE